MNAAGLSEPSLDELEAIAGNVCDPELPPLTLADLGILRSVSREADGSVVVRVTPTYSGCPAVEYIEEELRSALTEAGGANVRIERAFTPTWTTDWITAEGRRKLTEMGIAPPRPLAVGSPTVEGGVPVVIGRRPAAPPPCPHCGGLDTVEISPFGSTACKALFRCRVCSEPFDHFKEI